MAFSRERMPQHWTPRQKEKLRLRQTWPFLNMLSYSYGGTEKAKGLWSPLFAEKLNLATNVPNKQSIINSSVVDRNIDFNFNLYGVNSRVSTLHKLQQMEILQPRTKTAQKRQNHNVVPVYEDIIFLLIVTGKTYLSKNC